jgi:hypothetical protein
MHDRLHLRASLWRRSATLVSTLPALIACAEREVETDFQITSIAFDNESTITLTFSQNLGELGAVDPNDFRLSMGETQRESYIYDGATYVYEYTSYFDLGAIVYDPSFMVIEMGAANQLILRTTAPLGPGACEFLELSRSQFEMDAASNPDSNAVFDNAIFLHYAPGGAAGGAAGATPIESESGEPLADIGGDWVLNGPDYFSREGFGFTLLSQQLRLPCP